MRTTVHLPHRSAFHWHALAAYDTFLYRRVGDQDRELLAVDRMPGAVSMPDVPPGEVRDWVFGHACYDLFEQLEPIRSHHPQASDLPLEDWWTPRWVFERRAGDTLLHALPGNEDAGLRFAEELFAGHQRDTTLSPPHWEHGTSMERYLEQAGMLLRHIRRGDIYEVNFCTRRVARLPAWDPYAAFGRLMDTSPAAFAAFHRCGDHFALCASPERFLAFQGTRVMGQPMKGTRPRSTDPVEDERLAHELRHDPKERSENIMALDVMRHDLSKVAAPGSVQVEELCGVHAHARVHQMVSTVAAQLRSGLGVRDAVRAAFPMASMTGAPKFRAMQLIDAAEDQRRGLFSGTLGFFAPDGTADLNVVIRTIFHHAPSGHTSLYTGSALTAACDPRSEWEECELKARSVQWT